MDEQVQGDGERQGNSKSNQDKKDDRGEGSPRVALADDAILQIEITFMKDQGRVRGRNEYANEYPKTANQNNENNKTTSPTTKKILTSALRKMRPAMSLQ